MKKYIKQVSPPFFLTGIVIIVVFARKLFFQFTWKNLIFLILAMPLYTLIFGFFVMAITSGLFFHNDEPKGVKYWLGTLVSVIILGGLLYGCSRCKSSSSNNNSDYDYEYYERDARWHN